MGITQSGKRLAGALAELAELVERAGDARRACALRDDVRLIEAQGRVPLDVERLQRIWGAVASVTGAHAGEGLARSRAERVRTRLHQALES